MCVCVCVYRRSWYEIKATCDMSKTLPVLREAQNCRDKKTLMLFFAFPVLSGKFGKQSLRSLAAIYFLFGITAFLYQSNIPVDHAIDRKQFCASLKYKGDLWHEYHYQSRVGGFISYLKTYFPPEHSHVRSGSSSPPKKHNIKKFIFEHLFDC